MKIPSENQKENKIWDEEVKGTSMRGCRGRCQNFFKRFAELGRKKKTRSCIMSLILSTMHKEDVWKANSHTSTDRITKFILDLSLNCFVKNW